MPPLRRGTGRTASTSAPGRCFEVERHLSARVRTGVPYLSTARKSSVIADTNGTDASGPSFTTTSTCIAATTAPPPSSMSTCVRRYSSKCPSKRSECSIVVIVVACDNSPPMCVRPTDELKNGTPAANTLRILLSVPPIQHLSLLPRLDGCRVISSAVGKQSTPRAAPDNSASDTEGAEEETDGAARLDAFADASLADELAADESGAAVEP